MANRLSDVGLNSAFGFATVVAAINGAKDTFAVPFSELDAHLVAIAFFAYFFVFRIKMYLDDGEHPFKDSDVVDITIAISSWVLFIISAAALANDVRAAVQWLIAALVVSTVWILYSVMKKPHGTSKKSWSAYHRYRKFLPFNIAHIVGLTYITHLLGGHTLEVQIYDGAPTPAAISTLVLLGLIVLVIVDWNITTEISSEAGEE